MKLKIITMVAAVLLLISGIAAFASVADADAEKEIQTLEYNERTVAGQAIYRMILGMPEEISDKAQGQVLYVLSTPFFCDR